jgi:hypothetical protein
MKHWEATGRAMAVRSCGKDAEEKNCEVGVNDLEG